MSDDLIKRDDALAAITLGETMTTLQSRLRVLPTVDPVVIHQVDPAAIREAALREAIDACTYAIENYEIFKADGKTHENRSATAVARNLVSAVREDILALIGEKK